MKIACIYLRVSTDKLEPTRQIDIEYRALKIGNYIAGVYREMALALFLLACIFTAGCSITHVVRLENHQRIGVEEMIAEVRHSPLIFVGERHDSEEHHQLQLEVIKGVQQTGNPFAIGVEMFEIESQPALDAWIAGEIPEANFVRIYESNWRNLNYGLYQDIFIFARDNHIPIIALNAQQQLVRKVGRQGFSALSKDDLRRIPPGTTGPVSEESFAFMKAYYPEHGRNSEAFRHICEAQIFRNRVMAKSIIRYLAENPRHSMVVLTGGAHAWDNGGIPAELDNTPHKVILPPLPGIDIGGQNTGGADYLMD